MLQQLSFSMGVAIGAFILSMTMLVKGQGSEATLGANDFWPAMIGVAAIAALSIPFFCRLAPDAGADVSGHRQRVLVEEREG